MILSLMVMRGLTKTGYLQVSGGTSAVDRCHFFFTEIVFSVKGKTEKNKQKTWCHLISWPRQSKWFLWKKIATVVQQFYDRNRREEKKLKQLFKYQITLKEQKSLFHCKDQWALACRLKNAVIVLTPVSQPCQTHLLRHRSVALEHCLWMQWAHYRDTSGFSLEGFLSFLQQDWCCVLFFFFTTFTSL